jgi:hypothetical protein
VVELDAGRTNARLYPARAYRRDEIAQADAWFEKVIETRKVKASRTP